MKRKLNIVYFELQIRLRNQKDVNKMCSRKQDVLTTRELSKFLLVDVVKTSCFNKPNSVDTKQIYNQVGIEEMFII